MTELNQSVGAGAAGAAIADHRDEPSAWRLARRDASIFFGIQTHERRKIASLPMVVDLDLSGDRIAWDQDGRIVCEDIAAGARRVVATGRVSLIGIDGSLVAWKTTRPIAGDPGDARVTVHILDLDSDAAMSCAVGTNDTCPARRLSAGTLVYEIVSEKRADDHRSLFALDDVTGERRLITRRAGWDFVVTPSRALWLQGSGDAGRLWAQPLRGGQSQPVGPEMHWITPPVGGDRWLAVQEDSDQSGDHIDVLRLDRAGSR